jgi:hypothetical protein
MSKLIPRQGSDVRRSACLAAVTALLGLLVAGCEAEKPPTSGQGALELSVVGVTDHGQRYRVFGNYTLRGLQNGVATSVASAQGSNAAVVRRELPAGLYSVALEPGFVLRPLDAAGVAGEAWSAPARATCPARGNSARIKRSSSWWRREKLLACNCAACCPAARSASSRSANAAETRR